MDQLENCYIFLCSNSTEDECLQRMLFGGMEGYEKKIGQVKPGDVLFLYNYTVGRLHGEFRAESQSGLNIVPDAWNGKYPFQVKVTYNKEYRPLSKHEIYDILTFHREFPQAVVTQEQLQELRKAFERSERLPFSEDSFRRKFPANRVTDDGHRVRSMAELTIDNWLYHQEISHAYEIKVPISEPMYCDFAVSLSGQKEKVYIEYWGREDEQYEERKKKKIELYRKNK